MAISVQSLAVDALVRRQCETNPAQSYSNDRNLSKNANFGFRPSGEFRTLSIQLLGAVIKRIALFVTVAIAVAIGYVFWLDSRYVRAYERMVLGSTETELLAIAGAPSWVTDGTRRVGGEYPKSQDELVPGCVKELWYRTLPLRRFSYCFDQNGILVHKYNWVSW